jgi:hypothetical protein
LLKVINEEITMAGHDVPFDSFDSFGGIRIEATDDAAVRGAGRSARDDVPLWSRMWASVFAARYDQQVEQGLRVEAGTPLAAHHARLSSIRERQDLAASLTCLMSDAGLIRGTAGTRTRVPIRSEVVRSSAPVVADVLAKIAGPLPVRARGVARLRILLSDGRGPVYRPGSGSLAAAMRGVLAAM